VSQEQTSVAKEQIAASKETAPVPQELASMSPEQGPVLQEKEPASQDKASASQEQIPVSKEQTSVSKEPVSASQEQALVSQEQLPLSEVSPQIQSETSVQSAPVQKTNETRPPAESPAANKISLDIKGMDVVDVLKMLAQRANLNIVVGKNVTGRVTLFLKDTEPWDAFEIVILGNDLAYQKQGEIINIMTQRDYELQYGERFQDKKQAKIIKLRYAKAADLAKALNQIKTNVGKIVVDDGSNTVVIIDVPEKLKEMKEFIKKTDLPLQTQVFSLNYAAAEKLSPKLQEAITKGVGSLRIDERSNRIVVTDYPRSLAAISEIIKAFDDKTPQVLIDAQIIEIKPSDKFEMGVDWDYWIKTHFRTSLSLPINKTNALILSTATSTPTNPGDYKGIIDILRTIGDTKILSSPRIMVLNNQEAKILVGTKDAYITSSVTQTTGTAVTADTVNFVESGIKMFVTPTVNRDGFVTMKIKPEVSSAEVKSLISQDKKTDVPIITSSEAETTVMVKDGVTIIIGGLRRDRKLETVKKVPILGDLPGLRYFFSSTSIQIDKADLIILLTPHVMSGENSYTAFSEIKPRNGAVVDMRNGEIIEEKITAKPKTNLVPANAKK
jgi:type II secretory pathway component GspD/PulD (secretin)